MIVQQVQSCATYFPSILVQVQSSGASKTHPGPEQRYAWFIQSDKTEFRIRDVRSSMSVLGYGGQITNQSQQVSTACKRASGSSKWCEYTIWMKLCSGKLTRLVQLGDIADTVCSQTLLREDHVRRPDL